MQSCKIVIYTVLLLQALVCISRAEQSMSRLYTKGEWQDKDGCKCLNQQFQFMSEGARFDLIYDIETGKDIPPGKCDSKQWIFTQGFVPFGMTFPTMANWYGQGFFKIHIDGISLHDIPAKFRIVRASGPDTMLEGVWITSKGPVYVRFAMRGYDDKLLMQVALDTNTKADKIEVELLAYPQGFNPLKLCVRTGKRNISKADKIFLDKDKEPWAVYYDAGKKSGGPCGLVYVPSEVKSVVVDLEPYQINTILTAKPGGRQVTIGLWDFSQVRGDYSDNRSYVMKDGLRIVKDLDTVARADWLNAPLPAAWNPDDRIEMFLRRKQPTPFDQITTEVVTPHILWAKPLVGGPVRTLVVAPRGTQRETVELAQRLDMDFDTVCFSGNMLHFPYWLYLYNCYDSYGYERKTEFTVLNSLESKLREKHDCLILSWSFDCSMIPDEIKQSIVEKVRNGTGLLLFGKPTKLIDELFGKQAEPIDWSPSRVPLSTLPVIGRMLSKRQSVWQAYTFGEGRIVGFNYPVGSSWLSQIGMTPALSIDDLDVLQYYDYFHSLLAETVLWVSHRKMPVCISFGAVSNEVIIDSDRFVRDAEINVLIDDLSHMDRCQSKLKVDIPKGKSTHLLPDIGMPNGPRYLNVRITKNRKVLGWSTTYVELTNDVPVIKALELRSKVLQPGEQLKGTVQLSRLEPNIIVHLEVKDSAGRVLDRQQIQPTGTMVSFALNLNHPVMVLHYVTARLMGGDRVIDQRVDMVTAVQDRQIDDYHWLVWWGSGNNAILQHTMPLLVKAGVDWNNNYGIQGSSRDDAETHIHNSSRYGVRSVPYITRISPSSFDGRIRKPCLTDPEYLKGWVASLHEIVKGVAPYSPMGYSLGDENDLCGATKAISACTSPTCMAAFRQHLENSYGSVSNLNASWMTELKSFTDVMPATLQEVKDNPALWPRWVDHRLFMDGIFAGTHVIGREAIREIDPKARVGWEGLLPNTENNNWQRGYDFYQLCKASDIVQVYAQNKLQLEYVRSFKMPGSIFGSWYNTIGCGSEAAARSFGWNLLFHGCNSSWYWMADNTGAALVFPDMRPTPQLQWLSESIGEIRAGIGKLLLNSQRANDGIALHYSQASIRCGAPLLDRDVDKSQWGFCRLIEDLGFQYNFVASEEIASGCLKDYKVLILPASTALNPAEALKITAFVKRGGLVIADTTPGIINDHGKLLNTGQLDNLFGITRTGLPILADGMIEVTGGGLHTKLALTTFDATISLAGAKAWATAGNTNTPCVSVNKSVRGYTVLLNMPIEHYDFYQIIDGNRPTDYCNSLRISGRGYTVRHLMTRLLELGNVRPACPITANGREVDACETTCFTNGDIEYVCIIKDDSLKDAIAQTVTIDLPHKAHVYDVRKKQYLGYTNAVETLLAPLDPKVLALLPYMVRSVTVEPITDKIKAGSIITVHATIHVDYVKLSGQHCLHVEVLSPDGQSIRQYEKNILTTNSVVEVIIPTALNDPPGRWQIKVTDVATGMSGQAEFTVVKASENQF